MTKTSDSAPKICFVTSEYPPEWGGIAKSAKRIVKILTEHGFDVHVFTAVGKSQRLTYSLDPEIRDGVKLYEVPVQNFDDAMLDFYQVISQVDQLVRFDLFHGFYLPMAYPCVLVTQRVRRPVIASIRGNDGVVMLTAEVYKAAMTEVLRKANWITSVSRDSLERATGLVDISQRSSFIPNSIYIERPAQWKITDSNRGVVGTVCTFRRKKNLPLLIRSYSSIDPVLKRKLLLVGDVKTPEVRHDVINAIDECRLNSEVEMPGYVENPLVPQYLLSMHVFVLSSTDEGFPNAILEAAACGVPIVATAVDGVKDVFTDSDNALLVPSKDSAALTSAIEMVLKDDSLARRLSERGAELAREFTLEREGQAWIDLYRRMLSAKSSLT